MAETKTNIPIEIKMGNAGADNANLPAFKEGSIIFTKDTKKIYIDPVGETERIAVGGGGVDLSGKQDVFSDVEGINDGDVIKLSNFKYWDKATKDFIEKSGAKLYLANLILEMLQFSAPSATSYLKLESTSGVGDIPQINIVAQDGRPALMINVDEVSTTGKLVGNPIVMGPITAAGNSDSDGFYLKLSDGSAAVQLRGIKDGTKSDDAVNKKQLDTKQDKITSSTNLTAGTVTAEAGNYSLEISNQSINFVDRLISSDHPSISITMSGHKAGSSVTPANVSFLSYPQLTTALQNPYVTLSNIASPTANYQAANKKYVDDAIAAGGGSSITVDSELSGTSTNPVQNKVINSALNNKLDKFTQPAGVQQNGLLLYGVQDDDTGHSIQKMFILCTDAVKNTVVLRNKQGEILCETPTVSVTDKHAVNIGYLTTRYGSTNYSSQDQEFYLPSGSNLVIPNTGMGRLFMGSEGARSTDFKIYVNDPIDGGKLIITNLKTPTNDEDAVNKKYVDDIKTELLKAINHPYTYDETTKELTLIL